MTSVVSVSESRQIECVIAVMVTDQSVALVMVNDKVRDSASPVVTEENAGEVKVTDVPPLGYVTLQGLARGPLMRQLVLNGTRMRNSLEGIVLISFQLPLSYRSY